MLFTKLQKIIYPSLLLALAVFIIWGYTHDKKIQEVLNQTIGQKDELISDYQSQVADLDHQLKVSEEGILNLTSDLNIALGKIKENQSDISNLSGKVNTLRKLTEIDPELLKKYSKVYFLNEHYVPSSLTDIDQKFISSPERKLQIHTNVWPRLEKMLVDCAESVGSSLLVVSSYRSYGTQAILKSSYKITYGTTAANRFSAEQGYSEHQLGTTVDLSTPKLNSLTASFDQSAQFKWLVEHSHEYGFVLSYPKGNKYYIYEPWHWRYVGIDLATKLHNEDKYLYELDQREIDGYLVSIFD